MPVTASAVLCAAWGVHADAPVHCRFCAVYTLLCKTCGVARVTCSTRWQCAVRAHWRLQSDGGPDAHLQACGGGSTALQAEGKSWDDFMSDALATGGSHPGPAASASSAAAATLTPASNSTPDAAEAEAEQQQQQQQQHRTQHEQDPDDDDDGDDDDDEADRLSLPECIAIAELPSPFFPEEGDSVYHRNDGWGRPGHWYHGKVTPPAAFDDDQDRFRVLWYMNSDLEIPEAAAIKYQGRDFPMDRYGQSSDLGWALSERLTPQHTTSKRQRKRPAKLDA